MVNKRSTVCPGVRVTLSGVIVIEVTVYAETELTKKIKQNNAIKIYRTIYFDYNLQHIGVIVSGTVRMSVVLNFNIHIKSDKLPKTL
jgi:hypothetical protein